jgi:hypothetical protein
MKKDKSLAEKLWSDLGDIPTIEDSEGDMIIDDDFVISELDITFDRGCDIYEIWHWFEETFDLSVAEDLMGV